MRQPPRHRRLRLLAAGARAPARSGPQGGCELASQGDTAVLAVVHLRTMGIAFLGLWEPLARRGFDQEALPASVAHVAIRPPGPADCRNQTTLAVAARLLNEDGAR